MTSLNRAPAAEGSAARTGASRESRAMTRPGESGSTRTRAPHRSSQALAPNAGGRASTTSIGRQSAAPSARPEHARSAMRYSMPSHAPRLIGARGSRRSRRVARWRISEAPTASVTYRQCFTVVSNASPTVRWDIAAKNIGLIRSSVRLSATCNATIGPSSRAACSQSWFACCTPTRARNAGSSADSPSSSRRPWAAAVRIRWRTVAADSDGASMPTPRA
jgi:hypothetical protein